MERARHPFRRLLMVAAVGWSLAGCAAGSSASNPGSSIAASTVATATATSVATTAPTPSPSPNAIGQAADDGAAIIGVETIDARTRDLTIRSPSMTGTTVVRLLLPAGFDPTVSKQWPTLYLLHGLGGSHVDWTQMTDVAKLTAKEPMIVAMPDAADGFYSDWWNGGRGGPPMWETFHVTELPQLLERNWQAGNRRVIAGLSMGGLGALLYAARHRGMYRAAASFSGVADPVGGSDVIGANDFWGDPIAQADIWKSHDPTNLAGQLGKLALFVSYGDGGKGPLDVGDVPSDDLEPWIAGQNRTFVARLKALDIPATIDAYGPGSHDWPYWERSLHHAMPLLVKALGG
jgi:S-formylglutathione hydrolase FrmB